MASSALLVILQLLLMERSALADQGGLMEVRPLGETPVAVTAPPLSSASIRSGENPHAAKCAQST